MRGTIIFIALASTAYGYGSTTPKGFQRIHDSFEMKEATETFESFVVKGFQTTGELDKTFVSLMTGYQGRFKASKPANLNIPITIGAVTALPGHHAAFKIAQYLQNEMSSVEPRVLHKHFGNTKFKDIADKKLTLKNLKQWETEAKLQEGRGPVYYVFLKSLASGLKLTTSDVQIGEKKWNLFEAMIVSMPQDSVYPILAALIGAAIRKDSEKPFGDISQWMPHLLRQESYNTALYLAKNVPEFMSSTKLQGALGVFSEEERFNIYNDFKAWANRKSVPDDLTETILRHAGLDEEPVVGDLMQEEKYEESNNPFDFL